MSIKISSANNDEIEIIKRSQAGDKSAFAELVSRYKHKIYTISYQMVNDEDDALDISQEAFIKTYRSIKRFKGGSSFYTWLYRIVINLCIDFKRKHREVIEYKDELLVSKESHGSEPEQKVMEQELRKHIDQAIAGLPLKHRTAVVLKDIEGLSYKEIAQITRCSQGTVMSRLHYARSKLRDLLRPYI